jgi:hypothetical protein
MFFPLWESENVCIVGQKCCMLTTWNKQHLVAMSDFAGQQDKALNPIKLGLSWDCGVN